MTEPKPAKRRPSHSVRKRSGRGPDWTKERFAERRLDVERRLADLQVPSQIVATLSAQHKVDGSCIWRDIAEVRRTWRETAAPMLMEHRRDEYREAGRRGYNMAITERDENGVLTHFEMAPKYLTFLAELDGLIRKKTNDADGSAPAGAAVQINVQGSVSMRANDMSGYARKYIEQDDRAGQLPPSAGDSG